MNLSSQQIRSLRAEAHRLKLKPVVIIGQHGLNEAVLKEIDSSISHHELMKIRIPALEKEDKKQLIEMLCQQLGIQIVQNIGHVLVIYRENPNSKRPESQQLKKLLSA